MLIYEKAMLGLESTLNFLLKDGYEYEKNQYFSFLSYTYTCIVQCTFVFKLKVCIYVY